MDDEPMRYYLLATHEAELVACFRMMSDPGKEVVLSLVASQSAAGSQNIATPVKLSLVKKP